MFSNDATVKVSDDWWAVRKQNLILLTRAHRVPLLSEQLPCCVLCILIHVSLLTPEFDPSLEADDWHCPRKSHDAQPGPGAPRPLTQDAAVVKEIIHCKSCTLFLPNTGKSHISYHCCCNRSITEDLHADPSSASPQHLLFIDAGVCIICDLSLSSSSHFALDTLCTILPDTAWQWRNPP